LQPWHPTGALPYWTLVVLLIAFGCLGIFSIGIPILLMGITLAILFPRRHTRGVIASGVVAIVGFTLGFILAAPLSCTTNETSIHPTSRTVCANILGINYSGTGAHYPSLFPALIVGIVVGLISAMGARRLAHRLASRDAPPPPTLAA
jgi:MFS family permease